MSLTLSRILLLSGVSVLFLFAGSTVSADCPARMFPNGINPSGTIAGTYLTSAERFSHGFVRNGETITTFLVGDVRVTRVEAINPAGTIAGSYLVISDFFGFQGYVRAADGSITTFSVPGSLDTEPLAINPAGVTAGYYDEASDPFQNASFIRYPDGSLVTFKVPGTTGFTMATGINGDGAVTGRYTDTSTNGWAGFVRAPDGSIATFKIGYDTQPLGINGIGDVVGNCIEVRQPPEPWARHGFVRHADGTIDRIDAPGASETHAAAISPAGAVVGSYTDASGQHSFLRAADGTIVTFDAPGATSTIAEAISPTGNVTGYAFFDGCESGFVRDRFGVITVFNLPTASSDEVADGSLAAAGHAAPSLPATRELRLAVPVWTGGSWRIEYSLPADADLAMAVYDVAGRRLAVLDRGFRTAGPHQVSWAPAGVSRGMYFVRLQAGGSKATRAIAVSN